MDKIEPWFENTAPPMQYLDIFDDAIYPLQAQALEESPLFRAQLNAMRLHALWSILLRGAFIVPEQWLFSSLSFNQICYEILKDFEDRVDVESRNTSKRLAIDVPIRISFRDREGADEWSIFARSLHDVISNGSPIRLFEGLDPIRDQEDGSAREKFASLALKQIDTGNPQGPFSSDFANSLADLFPYQSSEIFAFNMKKLLGYGDKHNRFKQSSYEARRGQLVRKTQDLVFQDAGLQEKYPERVAAFRALFEKVHKDGIKPDQIMKMWDLLPELGLTENDQRSIEHVGRYIMHDTLAAQVGADYNSAAVGLYEPATPDRFDEEFVGLLADNGARTSTSQPSLVLPANYMEIASTRTGIKQLEKQINWREVWKAVWEIYHHPDLYKHRAKIITGLGRISESRLHEVSEWDDLFHFLNRRIQVVRFERNRHDSKVLNLLANGSERLAMIGGAASLSVESSLGIPIPAVAPFLVGALGLRFTADALPAETLASIETPSSRRVTYNQK